MSMISKRLLRRALHSSVGGQLMTVLEMAESRRANLLRVLTYHRVCDAEAFEEQMRYLATRYHVVSMPELLHVYQQGDALPPRSVMLTFDDAYQNFADCAWPILKAYGMPVSLFVPTAFPDRRDGIFWWHHLEHAFRCTPGRDTLETPVGHLPLGTAMEREKALSRMKHFLKTLRYSEALERVHQICDELQAPPLEPSVLGWDALRRLAAEGVTLGAHSRTHTFMNSVTAQEAEDEVVGPLRDLEREIGTVLPIFAYPDGRYNNVVIKVLRRAGFVLAFTTHRGTNDLSHADPLRLRRINISQNANVLICRGRLIHSSVYLNRWRRFFDPQPVYRDDKAAIGTASRSMGLETVRRARFLYKGLNGVMIAPLQPKQQFLAQLRSTVSPRSSHYERVGSLVNLVDTVFPGTARRASNFLCRPTYLPFAAVRVRLLCYGSGSTVFLLERKNGLEVLKIYRKSLGKDPQELLKIANIYRRKYETISSWYGGPWSPVLRTDILILRGPLLNRPAVGCLQPYMAGKKKDFFRDFSNDELVSLMQENNALRAQFVFFAKRTIHIYATESLCVDLLGAGNLIVITNGNTVGLLLIDYGIFDFKSAEIPSPTFARIASYISRLKSLLEEISGRHNR